MAKETQKEWQERIDYMARKCTQDDCFCNVCRIGYYMKHCTKKKAEVDE